MKHPAKRCIFIMVALFLLFLCAASFAENAALTIMVYMCGSDLESSAGAASADLDEIIAAAPDSSVHVIVMTGGSLNWHRDEIQSGAVQIHRVSSSGIQTLETLEAVDGPACMGDPSTLTRLIDYSVTSYPANAYALVLWDHGGGPMGGVCTDELHNRDTLTLEEIRQALSDSILPGKLRWIGFDACLMSSLEVACAVEPYAETMIACQGTEPGSGWNYSFLRGIERDEDGNSTGRRIVDAYFNNSASFAETLTMSCVDLRKIPAVIAEMDAFFGPLAEELTEEQFPQFYSVCSNAPGFARAGQTDEPGLDLVDLGGLVAGLSGENADGTALLDALAQAVTLSRSGTPGVSGLSVYHPLQNATYYMTSWRNTFSSLNTSEGYGKYISSFGKLLTSGSRADWTGMQPLGWSAGEDGQLSFALPLTGAQARDFASGRLLILKHDFAWDGSDNGYALVAVSSAVQDADGTLRAEYDGRLIYAENAEGTVWGPLSPTLRQDGSLAVRASAPHVATSWEQERTMDYLLYVLDKDLTGDQPEVDRVLIRDEAAGVYSSRLPYDEARYTSVEFFDFCRELPDLSGEIPAFNDWTRLHTHEDVLNLPSEWHFRMSDGLSAGDELIALFEITDIHGVTRCSRPTAMEAVGRTPLNVIHPAMGNDEVLVTLGGDLVDTPTRQALELEFSVSNLTDEMKTYSLWNLKINGTRNIELENGSLAFSWDIDGNRTKSGRLVIDASQLAGIEEIRDVSFDFQIGLNHNDRGEMKFELEGCDISGLTAAETGRKALAETTIGGIQWQLLDIRMDDNGDLDLDMRIHNGKNQTYDPYTPCTGIDINGIQLFGNHFYQKIKINSGETQDYVFHLDNTLAKSTHTIDGDWGYDKPGFSGSIVLTDRFLQRHGVREIRSVKFYLKEKDQWLPIELKLETPWPVPDDGRQRRSDRWTGALPEMEVMDRQVLLPLTETDEYSLKLERIYIGWSGFAVCLEAVNKADYPLELKVMELQANGQAVDLSGNITRETSLLPGTTSGWVLCSGYAAPDGTALESVGFTVRCVEEGSYDPPLARDQVGIIRLPENSIVGQMNGRGLEAETCDAEFSMDPVPENPGLFEPETRYVCIEYRHGSFSSYDGLDYLGTERFLIFHADGSAEYVIDYTKPQRDWWSIRGTDITLYNGSRWKITSENGKLIFRKDKEEIIYATEAEAARIAASRTPTPAPRTDSGSGGDSSGKILSIIEIVLIVLLIGFFCIRSVKKRQREKEKQIADIQAAVEKRTENPSVPATPEPVQKTAEKPVVPADRAQRKTRALLAGGNSFYALYTTVAEAPFVDASYNIWLFTGRDAYETILETHLSDWQMEEQELYLKEISPQEADSFFFTVCYQFGIEMFNVDRDHNLHKTSQYTSEPAEKYDRTKPGHVVTNPAARRHLIRFTQLVRSGYGATQEEKGKEYHAVLDALKDAEVLLLMKKTESGTVILGGANVSGRQVNTVYTDFEAIPNGLWNQGVRTGITERLEDQLRTALKDHRSVALNLNSTGGGIFIDEKEIRKLLNMD